MIQGKVTGYFICGVAVAAKPVTGVQRLRNAEKLNIILSTSQYNTAFSINVAFLLKLALLNKSFMYNVFFTQKMIEVYETTQNLFMSFLSESWRLALAMIYHSKLI